VIRHAMEEGDERWSGGGEWMGASRGSRGLGLIPSPNYPIAVAASGRSRRALAMALVTHKGEQVGDGPGGLGQSL
jgi:hypothetical protein